MIRVDMWRLYIFLVVLNNEMTIRMGYDCAMTSLSGASLATLRCDSEAGTTFG